IIAPTLGWSSSSVVRRLIALGLKSRVPVYWCGGPALAGSPRGPHFSGESHDALIRALGEVELCTRLWPFLLELVWDLRNCRAPRCGPDGRGMTKLLEKA